MKKISATKMRVIKLLMKVLPSGKRAPFLRKQDIFYYFGKDIRYASNQIPSEPYLVSIGDHSRIAANVSFITHDIINGMFASDPTVKSKLGINKTEFRFHMGTIKIGEYVMIGSNSTILYDITIGSHSIIAAGSVVTKNVPEGSIVGGNPARIIGSYYELAKKRNGLKRPTDFDDIETIEEYFWNSNK